jgi:Protein of unknown function (DUF2752)
MNDTARSRLAYLAQAAAPAVITTLAAVILLRFPPALYSFYPHCPIHQHLHILCPGCGTTRALAALLHGNIGEALHLNALTTLLSPAALVYAAACYRQIFTRRPIHLPQPPRAAIYATLAATAVFTVARNL